MIFLQINEKVRRDFVNQFLTIIEHQFCMKKLMNMKKEAPSESRFNSICQDLIFPERFRHKYLNPQRLPSYFKSKENFMKIKIIITEISDAATHRVVRRLGSLFGHGAIKGTDFGMFHAGLIVGP